MKYIVIIIIIVVAILFIAKSKSPGAAAKGGQKMSGAADLSQALTVKATIIRKDICAQATKPEQPKGYFVSGQNNQQTIYGVLYFELENKKKKHFYVSEKTFQNVAEGYHGTLTYAGNHLVRFEREE